MAEPKRRLRQIEVDEVSFVDVPANLRRFLILKRKGAHGMADEDVTKIAIPAPVKQEALRMLTRALDRMVGVVNEIKEAPEAEDEAEGAPMPPELSKEIDEIRRALEAVTEQYPGPGGKQGTEHGGGMDEEEDVDKTGLEILKEAMERLQSVVSRMQADESQSTDVLQELKAIGLLLAGDENEYPYPSPTAKANDEGDGNVSDTEITKTDPEVPPQAQSETPPETPPEAQPKAATQADVQKALEEKEAVEKRLEEVEKRLKESEDLRELKELEEHIAATYKHLPSLEPQKLAPVFKALREKAPDEVEKLEEILKAADALIAGSGTFSELAPQTPDQGQTAYERFKAKADELVQKNAGMTPEQARTAVLKTAEGRSLYNEHLEERRGRVSLEN